MSRRGLHGLFGALILVGLLALSLAFTFDGGAAGYDERPSTWVTAP